MGLFLCRPTGRMRGTGPEGGPQAVGRGGKRGRDRGKIVGLELGNHRPRVIGGPELGPAPALTLHIRLGPGHLRGGPPTLPAPAMVPRPCRADGAGSQAASPPAALGPAPLAAQEAAASDQPDLSACPWPWLWPQAGLGECAQMSGPGLAGALGAGAWMASLASVDFRLSWPWPGPAGQLAPAQTCFLGK